MNIAVLGAGAIGSAFAYQLAKSGHNVTAIARGSRLADLQRDGAIVLSSGESTRVQVAAALDATVQYDLVLVSVLAPQVAAVLEDLRRSAASQIMFMFNTFDSLAPLQEAVGAERFVFGFPGGVSAHLVDGKLRHRLLPGTTVGSARWTKVFNDAGIATVPSDDMQGWLRSHAAFVVPLMAIGVVVVKRGAGIDWSEARTATLAMSEAFDVVRELGHNVTPTPVALLSRTPRFIAAALFWLLSRTSVLRDLGRLGAHEPRMLIDMISRATQRPLPALQQLRPAA